MMTQMNYAVVEIDVEKVKNDTKDSNRKSITILFIQNIKSGLKNLWVNWKTRDCMNVNVTSTEKYLKSNTKLIATISHSNTVA